MATSEQRTTASKNCRANPSKESTLLVEERNTKVTYNGIDKRPVRVLALFEIFVDGVPARIPESMLLSQDFTGIEIVGVVATLRAPEGLFAQCGWFGNDDLDWYWARITECRGLILRADSRFRGGVPSLVLSSGFADYFLLCAHHSYDDNWESTRSLLHAPRCDFWPIGGSRPNWWPDQWADVWPFRQPIAPKPRAPASLEKLSNPKTVISVEPKNDVAHFEFLESWQMSPDGPDHPPNNHPQNLVGGKRHAGWEGLKSGRAKKAKWAKP